MPVTGICPSCYIEVDACKEKKCPNCGYNLKQKWPFSEEETKNFIVEGIKSQAERRKSYGI